MANKKSIIQQLQEEALNPKISVSDLLRKAKVVAVKLDLKELLDWTEKELNGYDVKNQEELPAYRIVRGETKVWNPFRGWMPILIEDQEIANLLSRRGVGQPIGALDDIVKSKAEGHFFIDFNAGAKNRIIEVIGFGSDVKFITGRNCKWQGLFL